MLFAAVQVALFYILKIHSQRVYEKYSVYVFCSIVIILIQTSLHDVNY